MNTNEMVKQQLTEMADRLYEHRHSLWEIIIAVDEWRLMMEKRAEPLFGTREDYLRLKLEALEHTRES